MLVGDFRPTASCHFLLSSWHHLIDLNKKLVLGKTVWKREDDWGGGKWFSACRPQSFFWKKKKNFFTHKAKECRRESFTSVWGISYQRGVRTINKITQPSVHEVKYSNKNYCHWKKKNHRKLAALYFPGGWEHALVFWFCLAAFKAYLNLTWFHGRVRQ